VASITEEAIDQIPTLIASGEWGPGKRLPREVDLASRLGLSRNSLREAVRALSPIRVLEARQGDGTYVSSLAPDLLFESTRMATDLLDRMFAAGDDVEELVEADAAFHGVLASAPGNAALRSVLKSLSTRTVRPRLWHGIADRAALDLARAERTRIAAGDAELARAATTVHIQTNERWLREHLGPAEEIRLAP